MYTLTLNFPPDLRLTSDQYERLAAANRDLRMELTADGKLIIMPPTGGISGKRNADLTTELNLWNRQAQLGVVFDSSTEFKLPNGAFRSPDSAWVDQSRWDALTPEQQETFPPICPDFVVELRSKTDSLKELRAKMQEYMENGCRLGWLINPQDQQVEVYRVNQTVEILAASKTLSGKDVLPGFVLDLQLIL
jgi:Uma2 family endonuclease